MSNYDENELEGEEEKKTKEPACIAVKLLSVAALCKGDHYVSSCTSHTVRKEKMKFY